MFFKNAFAMKIQIKLLTLFFTALLFGVLSSCNQSVTKDSAANPFSHNGEERNMIVVISDMHLGADLAYAEIKKNLPALEKFLLEVKASLHVKELVIAGDLLDEWFVPAMVDTYQGKGQSDFVKRIAAANKGVFDVLNSIIQEGKILVTYLPGNHDLTITAENIEAILPGIHQVRDAALGLGTYTPADFPVLAIEHGHRYNFFCAPDPLSNQTIAPGTITPPGYFFTRIATHWVTNGRPSGPNKMPIVTPNKSANESQDLMYRYWKDWKMTLDLFPIDDDFSEKIIVTNIDGFTGTFAVNDLIPYQSAPGEEIKVNLYNGIQDGWNERQKLNNVAVQIPVARAIDSVNSSTETDYQATLQYFKNPASDKRIVVFGHTHDPKILTAASHDNKKCIYANSGTWIDHNPRQTTMNFVVITPQGSDPASQTYVRLYYLEKGGVIKLAEDSLRY
jgi:UDP-2,3-diacylglucosamine pyrophosphatase LpxH